MRRKKMDMAPSCPAPQAHAAEHRRGGIMKKLAIMLALALPISAQGVKWEQALAPAQARAKAEKKQIFLDLWAEWCGPCTLMRKKVFPDPKAQVALSKVVPLEVLVETRNGKPQPEGVALARRYEVQGFPSLFILDVEGNVVRSHIGSVSAEELAAFIAGS
jgi:thiol:disulfide interchange protein